MSAVRAVVLILASAGLLTAVWYMVRVAAAEDGEDL